MQDNETFKVIMLLQNVRNSLLGKRNIYDDAYIEDVRARLPKIEEAVNDLKDYFQKHESQDHKN